MTSKREELLKRFKEERIAREKARIQMLHDMNRRKYNKNDENAWKYSKSNTSLNTSNEKSPVKNAAYKNRPNFARGIKNPIKAKIQKHNSFAGFGENFLNVSAPVFGNTSLSGDLNTKRRSMHNYTTAGQNESIEYSSPTSTVNIK